MKSLMICAAFFIVSIGLSNVSMADCDTPVLDRVACLGCKAKTSVKSVSRLTACHLKRTKTVTTRMFKSVAKAPRKLRFEVKRAVKARPRILGCCDVPSAEMGAWLVPATIVLPVAVMPTDLD
tara:strand:+ start:19168 stop:19536 length:369 start_codon:yes stop_codon:yes gene_type:complete